MNTRFLKLFFVVFFVLPFSIECIAQDLIVTSNGDSLNCNISEITSDNIHFTIRFKDKMRKTLIPMSKVESYQRGYYSAAAKEIAESIECSHLRIALSGGFAYWVDGVSGDYNSALRTYLEDLKAGSSYGVDATYYFNKFSGIGIKYQNYITKKETTSMSDDISISFIGPFYSSRFINSKNGNCVVLGAGLGYMKYKNEAINNSYIYNIKGATGGLVWDFGYDIALSKRISLGFQFSFYAALLFDCKVNDQYRGQIYESISHVDFSLGLRMNL